ncbi:MAG: phytanoyl-CoA dioxygenase family protein [Ramlibacter sp.]
MDPQFFRTDQFRAADEEKQAFAQDLARDGVAIIDPRIPEFEMVASEVVRETTRLQPGAGRLQDAWRRIDSVRSVAVAGHAMEMLAFAYGRQPVPFQTLNFTLGTQQRTHSDTIHFDSYPANFMCGVWTAFEDTDENNGALHYYPGSHRLTAMALEDFGISAGGYWNRNQVAQQYERALAEYVATMGLTKRVIPLRKGQALVWTANLFHGGEPILDKSRTRYSQVTHFYFEDCLHTQPLWSDLHGGRIMYKKVFDIARNRYITPMYNGKAFRLPLESHLREFLVAKVIGVRKS